MDGKYFVAIFALYLLIAYTSAVSLGKMKYLDVNENPLVNTDNENPTPIIGIVAQEVSLLISRKYPREKFTSYIAASYVKFVEGAGGRVVPIWLDQSRDYYRDILSKVNGVLWQGGNSLFNQSHGFAGAGRHIYEIAVEMNNNGTYFPIWGTCLGFELLVYLTANGTEPRTYCSSLAQALPLEFKDDFKKSRLFRSANDEVINILKSYAVTANFHSFCYTEETFAAQNLNKFWHVISVNHDWNGMKFISTIEHRKYPFYGVQFHPEKNIYEFALYRNITHTSRAIEASQFFANFFINEARRNRQRFTNRKEELHTLIYNYAPIYTALRGSLFEQKYLFPSCAANNDIMKLNTFKLILSIYCAWCSYKFYL